MGAVVHQPTKDKRGTHLEPSEGRSRLSLRGSVDTCGLAENVGFHVVCKFVSLVRIACSSCPFFVLRVLHHLVLPVTLFAASQHAHVLFLPRQEPNQAAQNTSAIIFKCTLAVALCRDVRAIYSISLGSSWRFGPGTVHVLRLYVQRRVRANLAERASSPYAGDHTARLLDVDRPEKHLMLLW